ncbi:MAG: restriction endonuclease subunit S [Saprospiraceae bacterium]|nr:restriction endonuclease subunit S [Saprospiraceae bacterium]
MKARLGDIAEFINGGAWSDKEYTETGIPVVKVTNLKNGTVDLTEVNYIPESSLDKYGRHILRKGDLVIATVGSHPNLVASAAGRATIIPSIAEGALLNQNGLCLRTNSEILHQGYLGYLGKSDLFQGYVKSVGRGAANQVRIALGLIKEFSFNLPPLHTQRKIASILSAYDDLIENNLKRIKLLEEKAQLHYKELMREMSYSKTKREEYIKDCLAFYIGGGWGEEDYKEKFTEPAYVIRGTDIPNTRGGNVSGIPLRFHKSSNLESRKMQVGDIVFEISNGQINNIGRTVLISKRLLGQFDQPVMCASFAKLIRVNEKVSPEFFYLYLNEGQENGLLYQYKSNSANGINNFAFETFIDEVKITIPKETELKAFTVKVKPIFTLISTLGEQNSKLREARDILLPKLMNGQIEV